MAISNELSSEIVTALLTAKERSPEELNNLKNVLLEVHSTLQEMTEKAREHKQTDNSTAKSASRQG